MCVTEAVLTLSCDDAPRVWPRSQKTKIASVKAQTNCCAEAKVTHVIAA